MEDGDVEVSAEADNLNLSFGDELGDELKIEDMDEYETCSEVTSSSSAKSDSESSQPSISSASSDSSDDDKDSREDVKHRRTRSVRGEVRKSPSPPSPVAPTPPPPKRSESSREKSKSYDYATKLNYLFRDARFFVIKSNNAENVTLSKAKGVWSTPPQNEAKLNQAYRESRNVMLVFSVKESGKFAGFARLGSESRRDVPPISWVLPPGLSAKALGGVFRVDWVSRKELPFAATLHLYNPWNEGKPVKIGRDGQEIEPRVAEELCRLFPADDGIEMTPILRRSKEASKVSRAPRRRHGADPPSSGRHHQRHHSWRFRWRGGDDGDSRSGKHYSVARGRVFKRPHRRDRYSPWYEDGNSPPSSSRDRPYNSGGGGSSYLADYVRSLHHHHSRSHHHHHHLGGVPYLPPPPPMPHLYVGQGGPPPPPPPPPYDSMPPPPPPPVRYYDTLPPLPEYHSSSRSSDKRSYDRSVDEFLWRTSERRERGREMRYRDRR
ncbi:YTH domain-containing protein 1-like [Ischnura elegans]|uniref:YTH domain-containing protein 1-like n=1 Tax=Ischnura elegans TaxID=197161 RepID=UPI001ED8A381|nr:YTH domain-containing protein 1-like [Ischnura elegans]